MSSLAEFYLGTSADVGEIEVLALSHPSWSQTHYCTASDTEGATVEIGDKTVDVYYVPLEVKKNEMLQDLDFGFSVTFGDLGEILTAERDRVRDAGEFHVKPEIRYYLFRGDDLTSPVFGPLLLEADSFSFEEDGATFDAKAPTLHINKTGELYTFDRFPMLRGFV